MYKTKSNLVQRTSTASTEITTAYTWFMPAVFAALSALRRHVVEYSNGMMLNAECGRMNANGMKNKE